MDLTLTLSIYADKEIIVIDHISQRLKNLNRLIWSKNSQKKRNATADVVGMVIATATSATRSNSRFTKKSTKKNLLTN